MERRSQACKVSVQEIALGMISGTIRPLLGARLLYSELLNLENEVDATTVCFIAGVCSETDGFPLGDERKYWASDALQEKDELAALFEERVRSRLMDAANHLLDQFADKPSSQ